MFFILFVAILVGPGLTISIPEPKESKLAHASNDLAFDLMKYYKNEKNVFISPFSISTALALVYQGSAGDTTKIMNDALKYTKYGLSEPEVHEAFQSILSSLNEQVDGYQLSSSNNVLVQNDFVIQRIYAQALKQYYSAEIESVDFAHKGPQIQSKINGIVEKATKGKITDFLTQPPSADAQLYLLNAVYFLGNWLSPFKVEYTTKLPFYNSGVNEVQVDTMIREGEFPYSNNKQLAVQTIALPYKGNASMVILLPDAIDGIADLEAKINQEVFDTILASAEKRRTLVKLPKFRLSHSANLVDALASLGLGELFSEKADLSRIAGEGKALKVSSVQHKAVIDVDEKGSEAAGATGIEIVPLSLPPKFIVDHPFLFFIRDDNTGMIMFSGRVDEL